MCIRDSLSTLHTNDAPTAINRLVDMGVPRFLLASSLRAVLAQRLVRLSLIHIFKASSVGSVSLPVITSAQRNGVNLRAFSIEVKLNPLQKILLDGDVAAREAAGAPDETEEGGSR